ncbi:hypothetical protein AOQ84DRAFT_355180 [Glonium stellatum]|uniref:Uncharacterized protein n=1 Tax=Glonium stellatum TaxID=574774 RepID=A0A8E2JRL0_9PEZI|nr:hypothetical protein AOQ84DRAFT_355180 [Glonium stellatum]
MPSMSKFNGSRISKHGSFCSYRPCMANHLNPDDRLYHATHIFTSIQPALLVGSLVVLALGMCDPAKCSDAFTRQTEYCDWPLRGLFSAPRIGFMGGRTRCTSLYHGCCRRLRWGGLSTTLNRKISE